MNSVILQVTSVGPRKCHNEAVRSFLFLNFPIFLGLIYCLKIIIMNFVAIIKLNKVCDFLKTLDFLKLNSD